MNPLPTPIAKPLIAAVNLALGIPLLVATLSDGTSAMLDEYTEIAGPDTYLAAPVSPGSSQDSSAASNNYFFEDLA